jgi:hypothetical protein
MKSSSRLLRITRRESGEGTRVGGTKASKREGGSLNVMGKTIFSSPRLYDYASPLPCPRHAHRCGWWEISYFASGSHRLAHRTGPSGLKEGDEG